MWGLRFVGGSGGLARQRGQDGARVRRRAALDGLSHFRELPLDELLQIDRPDAVAERAPLTLEAFLGFDLVPPGLERRLDACSVSAPLQDLADEAGEQTANLTNRFVILRIAPVGVLGPVDPQADALLVVTNLEVDVRCVVEHRVIALSRTGQVNLLRGERDLADGQDASDVKMRAWPDGPQGESEKFSDTTFIRPTADDLDVALHNAEDEKQRTDGECRSFPSKLLVGLGIEEVPL